MGDDVKLAVSTTSANGMQKFLSLEHECSPAEVNELTLEEQIERQLIILESNLSQQRVA